MAPEDGGGLLLTMSRCGRWDATWLMTRMQADKAVVDGAPLTRTKGESRVPRRPGLR